MNYSPSARGARLLAAATIAIVGTAPGSSLSASATPLVSTGLANLGNTCYMNAQLECAFHIPAVRQIILAKDEIDKEIVNDELEEKGRRTRMSKSTIESDALKAMKELITDMVAAAQKDLPATMTKSFCTRLGIPVNVQQDSQEFWKLLLPAINKESFSDLYKGSFEGYITALDGSGREKRREELFLDLSLDVASSKTLSESLEKSFGKPELLSVAEGNGWRPEKGARKVDAHKGYSLITKGLPPILQCHLKRFNYDWQTDTMTKLNSRFEFPEVLELSGFCGTKEDEDSSLTTYDLQAVVVHVGQYGAGHYCEFMQIESNSSQQSAFF
eukprot:scaffold24509_cov127-Cylindrotheca_fusiformis.AAC.6